MKKVDIVNGLYHAIMSEELGGQDGDYRYAKLQSILRTGYLYSVNKIQEHDIRVGYPHRRGLNPDDYICLGCNPHSSIAHPYTNLLCSNLKGDLNGYTMSQLSFGFVLDKSLLDELETKPGCFDYEIFVKDEIPINKYALGIINAGGTISKAAYVYKEFVRYSTGEITKREYQHKASEIVGREIWNIDWYMNNSKEFIDGYYGYFLDFIEKAISQDYMPLINKSDRYSKVKEKLTKCGSNIPILDSTGVEIPSLGHQKEKVLSIISTEKKSKNS